jgi:hypothetical protein
MFISMLLFLCIAISYIFYLFQINMMMKMMMTTNNNNNMNNLKLLN